jgi:hypothetical protein
MTPATCFNILKICALRVTLLNDVGDVASGSNNFCTSIVETKVGWTADTDKGKDLFYRGGCDQALAAYKSPELLKRMTLALDTIGIDPALMVLLLASTPLDDGAGNIVGYEYALQDCPTDPLPPLVAIEAWSYAYICDAQSATTPFVYTLFPMAQFQASGEWAYEVDFQKPAFAGFTRRNNQWGHGPYGGVVQGAEGGPVYDTVSGGPPVFLTSTAPPAAYCGLQTVTPSS